MDTTEIEARLAAATPGPWEADGTEVSQHWSCPEPWLPIATNEVACMAYCYGGSARGIERVEDAEFIAHAREDVPVLLAEVKELTRWKAEALEVIDGLQELGRALGLPLGERVTGPAALEKATTLRAQVEAVRKLHTAVEIEPSDTVCSACSWQLPNGHYFGQVVEWPCPTIRALRGEE